MEQQSLKIIDGDGQYASIAGAELLKNELVPVQLESGENIYIRSEILKEISEGVYAIPVSFKSLAGEAETESRVIPVVEEEIEVHKSEVSKARVVVNKTVHEREVTVDETLTEENVRVERIPKNIMVEAPIPVRQEGDVTIISLVEEVLVVEKRLMLKEEVRIIKEKTEVQKPQNVTLHREEVNIERIPFQNDGKAKESL